MNTVRWNIAVSPELDQSVRMFLAAQGGGRRLCTILSVNSV